VRHPARRRNRGKPRQDLEETLGARLARNYSHERATGARNAPVRESSSGGKGASRFLLSPRFLFPLLVRRAEDTSSHIRTIAKHRDARRTGCILEGRPPRATGIPATRDRAIGAIPRELADLRSNGRLIVRSSDPLI
jgi:hypothetical protein